MAGLDPAIQGPRGKISFVALDGRLGGRPWSGRGCLLTKEHKAVTNAVWNYIVNDRVAGSNPAGFSVTLAGDL